MDEKFNIAITVRDIFNLFGNKVFINIGGLFFYNGLDNIPMDKMNDVVIINKITSEYMGDQAVGTYIECFNSNGATGEIDTIGGICNIIPKDKLITIKRREYIATGTTSSVLQETSGDSNSIISMFGDEKATCVSIIGNENCGVNIIYYPDCGDEEEEE